MQDHTGPNADAIADASPGTTEGGAAESRTTEGRTTEGRTAEGRTAEGRTAESRTTEGRIVGIGASAGGLESLEQLFSALPKDTGLAFIVIQHLSPDFRSLMDELIARHSDMPVHLAADGMPVEPNHIYLMPPRKEMIIRDRHLWLTDKEPHTFSLPIDAFFRSLAQDVGPQAVAVVLSGSGSDGSRGILDVKRAGGLVLAEAATTAKFDGMPLSAAQSGVVDHVQAPSDLARLLCGLPPLASAIESELLSEDPVMDVVLRLLRDSFGIDFSLYKMTTVGRRIQRRVEILRLPGLPEYVEQLMADSDELNRLYQDLLIGVTQFFRDPEAFETIEHEVIPKLLDALKPDEELRVWTAGCATGEEAYSLAMLFFEAFEARKKPVRLKLLATDVHQRSLEHASAGVYGDQQLAHVSPSRLERFFTKRPSGYQVTQELRQLIVFARHNVTKDAPFTKMHFISCRNMLIYLQPQAQRTVLSLFHFGLVSGGMLFLGASETPGVLSDEFSIIDDRWKLFRKRRDVHLLNQVRLPALQQPVRRLIASPDAPRSLGADPLILATYDQLLDMFMPPGLLVDEDRTLIDAFGGAEKLMRWKARRPSANVLELLPDELRTVVAGAIQRALKERSPVSYTGVRMPARGGEIRCVVTAHPLTHPRTGARNALVTFRDMAADDPARDASQATAVPLSEASQERMTTLETELAYTRETLQATIEELETSNEEMQATNEELVASNEELQSTNEELHSVNEELYTVNAEYQRKISELKELNADMAHLLEGTDVGTVFLDRELRIRRFTSRIAGVFRFQSHDIGREIGDFSHNIERPTLMDDIANALHHGAIVEDEVRDRSGTPFFLRILPYHVNQRTTGHAEPAPIDGVVLTLTDMTALDTARTRVEQLLAIVEWSDDGMLGQTLDGTITSWNHGAENLYGYTAAEAIGQNARMLMRPGSEAELAGYLAQIAQGQKVEHATAMCKRKDGALLEVSVMISPILVHGKVVSMATSVRDIARLVETQRELQAQQAQVRVLLHEAEDLAHRREEFLAMLSHELRNPLAAVLTATVALEETPDATLAHKCQSVIGRQAKHMKRLLDDLLDVSRITTHKFAVETEDVDLRDSIETAIEATVPIYRERGVELARDLPQHAVPVRGDGRRLTQVVANLLSNAATYSPRGSSVKLTATLRADAVVVRVTDQGDGIDPELQPRIFDLFVQAEQKLDRQRGGLGVGLSLAKTIVELHGGAIEVHSEGAGAGSEFQVELPLARSYAASALHGILGGRCKIVLVDDQEDSRDMLRMLFEARKHVVFGVGDGAQAVQVIAQQKPDVAFIDIGLPIMNGFEVAQQIRKRPELNGVMLVALSGYGNSSDIAAALEAGFDEHVTKPADVRRLEQILARKKPSSTD